MLIIVQSSEKLLFHGLFHRPQWPENNGLRFQKGNKKGDVMKAPYSIENKSDIIQVVAP